MIRREQKRVEQKFDRILVSNDLHTDKIVCKNKMLPYVQSRLGRCYLREEFNPFDTNDDYSCLTLNARYVLMTIIVV